MEVDFEVRIDFKIYMLTPVKIIGGEHPWEQTITLVMVIMFSWGNVSERDYTCRHHCRWYIYALHLCKRSYKSFKSEAFTETTSRPLQSHWYDRKTRRRVENGQGKKMTHKQEARHLPFGDIHQSPSIILILKQKELDQNQQWDSVENIPISWKQCSDTWRK